MSSKSRTESELWDAIEAIAHGQAAMAAAEYGLGEQRESYVTNHALRNLLKGLVREARAAERSAGAPPLDAAKVLLVLSEWDGVLDVGDDRQRFVEYLVDRLGTDR